MLQNGRKPTRTLVAFQHPSQRLEPPADLTRNENRVWRDVVNSRPADWFDRDSAYLLINFCRHTVMARRLTNQIEASDPSDIATLEKLLRMRNAETSRRADSLTRGERNIQWIEQYCFVPEGRDVGKPMVLREWQRDIIHGIYDTPTRRAIVSFCHKNGKTALSAMILLLHLADRTNHR